MPTPERIVSDNPLFTWEYDEIPWMEVILSTAGKTRGCFVLWKSGAEKANVRLRHVKEFLAVQGICIPQLAVEARADKGWRDSTSMFDVRIWWVNPVVTVAILHYGQLVLRGWPKA